MPFIEFEQPTSNALVFYPYRERYLDHKIDQIAQEAKSKLAVGDKRSTYCQTVMTGEELADS